MREGGGGGRERGRGRRVLACGSGRSANRFLRQISRSCHLTCDLSFRYASLVGSSRVDLRRRRPSRRTFDCFEFETGRGRSVRRVDKRG